MNKKIMLSQGNGGKQMRQLIDDYFAKYLKNDLLNTEADAIQLPVEQHRLMTTVDGYTVQPVIFPGGDIGSLCIHGTVNDLAVSGAQAKYITLAAIIEEGMELEKLEVVIKSIARAAKDCEVSVICGDTKVVPRGHGGEIYLTTTGIGRMMTASEYSIKKIKPGDKIIISGTIGDHGAAVMLAREEFGLTANINSDSASVYALCQLLYPYQGVRFMRDPTRGGLATVLHEIILASGYGVEIIESQLPVADEVKTICDILGYDFYYLANEGRVVAVVDAVIADLVVSEWKQLPGGRAATIIGEVTSEHNLVALKTALGGEKIIQELNTDPLPRIC